MINLVVDNEESNPVLEPQILKTVHSDKAFFSGEEVFCFFLFFVIIAVACDI